MKAQNLNILAQVVHEKAMRLVNNQVGYYWEYEAGNLPILEVFFRATEEEASVKSIEVARAIKRRGISRHKANVDFECHEKGYYRIIVATDFTEIEEEEMLMMLDILKEYGKPYEEITN